MTPGVFNEITAHARAACEINPEVDTIIEIGGQDSKFTTLKDGRVTFSVMNNVCAAGTGSFIEEQAKKLGVPLNEYAGRVMNRPAPLTSDRCTVFMESDLVHCQHQGTSVPDLTAVLSYSIAQNYINRVVNGRPVGEQLRLENARLLDVHSLGDYTELPPTARWLEAEMAALLEVPVEEIRADRRACLKCHRKLVHGNRKR